MPASVVLLELGVVLVGLAVLARLSARGGFSPMPLYLLAGLAFGRGGVLPLVTADRFIEVGAEIGIILLLLMLGLEFTAEELTESLRESGPVGAVDLALNMTPGVVAGWLLGWDPLAWLFLGGATYISSSGIVARLLEDLRWVGNHETPVTLSILVIEDLAMAVFLPVLAALLQGGGAGEAVIAVAIALGLALMILFVALRWGARLSRAVVSPSDEGMLLTILGLTFLIAGIAERVQVSAAVGAFLVGLAISGPAVDRVRDLLNPLRYLFAGVFFAFLGLRIDPASIPPVLGAAAGLAAEGIASKLATGWWAARRAGVGPRGRLRAAAAIVARGEFSLVIAGLAVAAGLEPELGPLVAAYVIILAVIGPLMAKLASMRRAPAGAASSAVTE